MAQTDSSAIDFTVEDLKSHLKDTRFSPESMFQIYVIQKRSHLFSKLPHGIALEMEFRRDIASAVKLTLNEVNIVGSAQVGFSIKPNGKLRKVDEEYELTRRNSDRSDIDVALVSQKYFETVHHELHKFTDGFKNSWQYNAYYSEESRLNHFPVKRVDHQFLLYFAQGWIRPDLVPDSFRFAYQTVCDRWKAKLNRKIAIAIYRDWKSLKEYQARAFEKLRAMALRGEL